MTATPRTDWSGADDASRKELEGTLQELLSEWPGVVPGAVLVEPPLGPDENQAAHVDDDNTMGETDGRDNVIRIAPHFAKNYSKWTSEMEHACKRGSLRQGLGSNPAAYTLTHEYGHVLSNVVFGRLDQDDNSGDPAIRALVRDVWELLAPDEASKKDVRGLTLDTIPLGWTLGYGKAEIAQDLSDYATASPHELIAESFAIHRILGPGHSKTADFVAQRLEDAYTAKFGARSAAA